MNRKITSQDCVLALRDARNMQGADYVAAKLGATTRAVAAALRSAIADGRVTIHRTKSSPGRALYRFARLKAKATKAAKEGDAP